MFIRYDDTYGGPTCGDTRQYILVLLPRQRWSFLVFESDNNTVHPYSVVITLETKVSLIQIYFSKTLVFSNSTRQLTRHNRQHSTTVKAKLFYVCTKTFANAITV